MKLTTLLLIISLFRVQAGIYSQNTLISLNLKSVKVIMALEKIESQSQFKFLVNENVIHDFGLVSIKIKRKRIEKVLDELFSDTNITYKIIDRQIVLRKRRMNNKVVPKTIEKKNYLQSSIQGTITDEKGQPLPGASIIEKGTTNGAQSDFDGNFSLLLVNQNATLVISYIGFATKEVVIDGQTNLAIALEEDTAGLDEVVVVGYGAQKKINLTGAIATTSGKVLENRAISNVLEGLQGTVGGLNITNSNGGPGSAPKINIRGATSINGGSPLVLVDGAQMNLSQVNPNDIESISVLKDAASAAIYGSRAAYGVILVTTKKGKRNTKTRVTYSSSTYLSKPTTLPKKSDSYKFALYVNEMRRSDNKSTPFNNEHLALIKATVNGTGVSGVNYTLKPGNSGAYYEHANTNWSDLVFNDAALGRIHNLSVSGGSKKTSYHTSFGYTGFDGVVKVGGDNYKRYNINLKLDTDVFKWLTSYFQVNFSKESINSYNAVPGHGSNLFHTVWRARPILTPTFEKDGTTYPTFIRLNPVSTLLNSGRKIISKYNLNTKFGLKMTFGKIGVFSNFTYNPYFFEAVENNKSIKSLIPWKPNNPIREDGKPEYVRKRNGVDNYYAFDAYTQYENTFNDKHYLKAMVGYNQEWKTLSNVIAYNTDLISPDVISLTNTTGEHPIVSDAYNQWALRGAFMRLNYTFKDRYLIEVNGRYDGSSRFKKDDRFGFFPSISAGWRISEEVFMNNVSFVDNFKLRASYGSLGNQSVNTLYPISEYQTISQVRYGLDGARPVGLQPGNPLASSRTWETVSTINYGLDATLFRGLNLTFDIYKRTTEDMLVSGDALPGVYGANTPQKNAADLEVNGWEASLSWRNQLDNGIKYNIGFMLSDWKGEITKFENPTKSLSKAFYKGETIGQIWGYETMGLFQTPEEIATAADHSPLGAGNLVAPGDVHYADLNNDGEINPGDDTVDNPGDRKIIGNMTPRYSYGIRGEVDWKGFDFNFFFQGVGKRDFWLTGPLVFGGTQGYGNSIVTDELYNNIWSDGTFGIPENRNAFYFRPSEGAVSRRNSQIQTRYLQNAAYLRLKNITLGYSLPNTLVNKIGISGCRLYLSAENMLTFTKLKSNFDPEVLVLNESGQGATSPRIGDSQTGKSYPISKRLLLGIKLNF